MEHGGKAADNDEVNSASQRRCSRLLMSLTELLADSLKLQRHIQRSLMMHSTLFVRVAQALFNETEIYPGALRIGNRA